MKCVSFVMSSYSMNTTLVKSSRLSSKRFFFVCGLIEVEEKDLIYVRIDKQISGCDILMHNS